MAQTNGFNISESDTIKLKLQADQWWKNTAPPPGDHFRGYLLLLIHRLTLSTELTWGSSPQITTRTSPSQSPTPTALKRQRSTTTMSNFPPLPKLPGEVILDVYTHKSLRFPGAPSDDSEYGDNERLAILGEKVLETAVTDTLFRKRPMLKADEIEVRRRLHALWGLI